jgi:16S rRNA (guanine(1405)-N(7))-methyltransferase
MRLDELISQVTANPAYASIAPTLVRRVAERELAKGRPDRELVKAVRAKLHQVAGAYQEKGMDFTGWRTALEGLPSNSGHTAMRSFCAEVMKTHASTRERLPILADFYQQVFAALPPIHSVLDLACGLNPLAIPWMRLAEGASYQACDIYTNLVEFLADFIPHLGLNGGACLCDLTEEIPQGRVQLAIVLKTLPVLEQLEKDLPVRLLAELNAEHILVSYPGHSLGGRSKGMLTNYAARFEAMTAGKPWHIQRLDFPGELAYLIHK